MSTDTIGRIKGYITADAICQYIKKHWDLTAESNVTRSNISSVKKITWDYLVKPHMTKVTCFHTRFSEVWTH